MKPVAFIEGQQSLFGFHDDSDIPVMHVSQEAASLPISSSQKVEDDEAERRVDTYINQGFNPRAAREMVYGVSSEPESFGSGVSVVAAVTPCVQQRVQNRHQSRGVGRMPRRLSAKELRAQETLPYNVNER